MAADSAPMNLTHHFLIAMPGMEDKTFNRSVVYLCEHSERGALGLVINKPSDINLKVLFEKIELHLARPELGEAPVFQGGPVQTERGFVLHEPVFTQAEKPEESVYASTMTIPGGLEMTTSKDVLEALATGAGPRKVLVSLGYAAWGEGQLESELAENSWLTVGADPAVNPVLAVRLTEDADPDRVAARLTALGVPPQRAGGATTSNAAFLGVLADVLRVLAGLTGVVCLYALVQGLALTARERRSTVAVLRATGAGQREVAALFAGAAVAAVVPALLVGIAVHQWLLAPAVAHLAAGYADLPVGAGAPEILVVALGLAALGLGAAAWMTRRARREPVVVGLREE